MRIAVCFIQIESKFPCIILNNNGDIATVVSTDLLCLCAKCDDIKKSAGTGPNLY